jgi:ABC-type histidine transport system ATPase subunit
MLLILHGINLKCGKNSRMDIIGSMDSLFFVCVNFKEKQGMQNEHPVK